LEFRRVLFRSDRENALIAEALETLLIDRTAGDGCRIELPISRMHDRAEASPDRKQTALWNRVGSGDHLDIEGPHFEPPIELDLVDGDLEPVAVLGELRFEHAGCERGCINRSTKTRPKVDDRTDMVFVGMRKD